MNHRWVIIGIVLLSVAALVAAGLHFRQRARHKLVPALSLSQKRARDVRLARRFWGSPTKCDGSVLITYKELSYRILAYSDFDEIYPERTYLNCKIIINSLRVHNISDAKFCTVIIHEYGHLHGRGHSDNPYSIMYPVITDKNIPRICRVSP